MKVACVGGGPAGLYFSILMKRQDPAHEITVHERNPEGSTYGWGVTYWGALLEELEERDPGSAAAIRAESVRWNGGVAHVSAQDRVPRTTTREGDEGFGIGRRRLLDLLTERARELGVRVEFEREVTAPPRDADLVVACDGINSGLRGRHGGPFGTEVTTGSNKYIWLGTSKVFDAFTFSFVETAYGWIWCYAYRFSADASTCVFECGPETWKGLGLNRAKEADGLALLEQLFAPILDGEPLIGRSQAHGPARWLSFRTLNNERWHRDNVVLLGDAAHTTHYSIGAGTTLALEDAMALADALGRGGALGTALDRYESDRRAAIVPAQSAAHYSAQWYENLPRYIALEPRQMFALLGQRHSPLLPYVPPQLYYRIDQAASGLDSLRRLKRWLGPRVARSLHSRIPVTDS